MIQNSIRIVILLAITVCPVFAKTDTIGINHLQPDVLTKIDNEVKNGGYNYTFVKVGLVYDGKIVFTKAYGDNNNLDEEHIWASISKPLTTMIAMQLVKDGFIKSIEDNIWDYSDKYIDVMPDPYADCDLTIKYIMTHTSGIPHYDDPTWIGDKLNIQFEPGTKRSYSTHAWGVLGDVLTAVTDKSYNTLVKEYNGVPIGTSSIWAIEQDSIWRSPGGFVHSTIKDLVHFSIGVMNNIYVTEQTLYDEIAQVYISTSQGLGWNVSNANNENVIISHSGSASDGSNMQTYLRVKPKLKLSAGAMGKKNGGTSFGTLCQKLMDILENDDNPTAITQLAAPHNASSGLSITVDTKSQAHFFIVSADKTANVTLVVYDVSGRTLWKHYMAGISTGRHAVQWPNSSDYAGRMLIVSVHDDGKAKKTKRFLLLK